MDAFLDEKTSPWGVTATTYFTVRKGDGRVVGTLQLRHSLRGELVHGGGHIGYAIRPTERGKGYAKQQLALALEQADGSELRRLWCRATGVTRPRLR